MKTQEFNDLIKQDAFKEGFKGALSLLIAEIVDANTQVDGDGKFITDITTIDYFEYKRREWAYKMGGMNGSVEKYLSDLRPLFPPDQAGDYEPFTIPQENSEYIPSKVDATEVEDQLKARIEEGGFINYWAGCRSEDQGKTYQNGQWV